MSERSLPRGHARLPAASPLLGLAALALLCACNRSAQPAEEASSAALAEAPVEEQAQADPPAAPSAEAPPEPQPSTAPEEASLKSVRVKVDGALESALARAVGPSLAPSLAQVVTRALVWWIRFPSELLRGDELEVLYETRDGQEPVVHAVRFHSNANGKVHRAYRFKAPGDSYPRLYLPDGSELELRLRHPPLGDYEQVTSLLRDGRGHQGVDFKAPVGTPIHAPFEGTLTRKNWRFRRNGNCLELTEMGGARRALFLHLDVLPKDVKVGMRVRRGQLLGRSGNSGRSYAPHLHYQLMSRADRPLDPFARDTYRRRLPPTARAGLAQQIARLEAAMGSAPKGRSGSRFLDASAAQR